VSHVRLEARTLILPTYSYLSSYTVMPKQFGAPFDYADGDLILRSCDDVDFVAHKLVLSLASPFFCDLPYDISDERENGLPVIPLLNEDCHTVERLLRIVYPGVDRPSLVWLSRTQVRSLLEVARKYHFDGVFEYLERMTRLPTHFRVRTYFEEFALEYQDTNTDLAVVVEERKAERQVEVGLMSFFF
jgi:hypothetical protein